MSKKIVSQSMMSKIQGTFENMLASKKYGSTYNHFTFTYQDVMNESDGRFTFPSDVSSILKTFQAAGYVTSLRKGTNGVKSEFDIQKLMIAEPIRIDATGSEIIMGQKVRKENKYYTPKSKNIKPTSIEPTPIEPESTYTFEVTEEADTHAHIEAVEVIDIVTPVAKVSHEEFRNEIREMVSFMQSIPKQMVGSLTEMMTQLDAQDPAYVAELESTLDATIRERDDARKQLQDMDFQLIVLKEKLRTSSSLSDIDTHEIYRIRNSILDEMERYIYLPGWKKQTSTEKFRKEITSKLDAMLQKIAPKEEAVV